MSTPHEAPRRRESPHLTDPVKENFVVVTPPVDIYENQDEFLLVADLPGVHKDALSVRLDGAELLLEGSQPDTAEAAEPRPLAFRRAFRVSREIDPNGIAAELVNGVLTVHLAKSQAAKPRRIEVRGA